MERRVRVVIAVASLLAILSAAFGFAAEGTRVKSGGIEKYDECRYPRTPAVGLGLTAVALLLLAQITVHAFAGCICCTKRAAASGRSRAAAWIALFFSWLAFLSAQFLLLISAALNTPSLLSGMETCEGFNAGWSAGGAVLGLASVFLGIGYYSLAESFKKTAERSASQQGQERLVASV